MVQSWAVRAVALAGAMVVVAGCGATSPGLNGAHAPVSSTPNPSATVPSPTYPTGPPMQVTSVAPVTGSVVGVAMPISIVFNQPVADSARKAIEDQIMVTSSIPMTGAWHWFSPRRVDFRPTTFWKSGTKVSMVAHFNHLSDGNGRYGTQDYTTNFTIGTDVETHVYVDRHLTVVTQDGKVLRSMPSDAGSPDWPSWDGTMAVIEKLPTVRMTSCSVDISCDKNSRNYYDITLPFDVRLTWSGTFVHYSTGDPTPGHGYGSHGCVHLSYANAQWYYNLSKVGDPVVITGSPRGNADGDNGYAGFNLSWQQWLASSARGQFTT